MYNENFFGIISKQSEGEIILNVLAQLDKELQDRKNYTLEQKERYIYVRTCQIFSYDSRAHYCNLLGSKGTLLQQELLQKSINLENVTDFKITCKNYAYDIYREALYQLLGVKSVVKGDGHYWTEFKNRDGTIKADATMGDLTRVKMKCNTKGYRIISKGKTDYPNLKQIDQNINYIDEDYTDYFIDSMKIHPSYSIIKKLGFKSKTEAEKEQMIETLLMQDISNRKKYLGAVLSNFSKETAQRFERKTSDELLLTKIEYIHSAYENYHRLSELYEGYYNLSQFEDARIVVGDFLLKIGLNLPDISLFQEYDDRDWEFINLYPLHLKDDSLYFALTKRENKYHFNRISEEEALIYTKELKGMNKQYIYRKSHR